MKRLSVLFLTLILVSPVLAQENQSEDSVDSNEETVVFDNGEITDATSDAEPGFFDGLGVFAGIARIGYKIRVHHKNRPNNPNGWAADRYKFGDQGTEQTTSLTYGLKGKDNFWGDTNFGYYQVLDTYEYENDRQRAAGNEVTTDRPFKIKAYTYGFMPFYKIQPFDFDLSMKAGLSIGLSYIQYDGQIIETLSCQPSDPNYDIKKINSKTCRGETHDLKGGGFGINKMFYIEFDFFNITFRRENFSTEIPGDENFDVNGSAQRDVLIYTYRF